MAADSPHPRCLEEHEEENLLTTGDIYYDVNQSGAHDYSRWEDQVKSDSCGEMCAWTCCCICRGDGTPIGTRALDLIARCLFYMAGMTTNSFHRPTWDCLTSTQIVSPALEGCRGIASRDIIVPGAAIDGEYPPVPVRLYKPLGAEGRVDKPVMLFFHGGGFCIQSERSREAWDLCRA